MCVTCGCSDDANPTLTMLDSLDANEEGAIAPSPHHHAHSEHDHHHHDHHHHPHHHHEQEHTHVLADGTTITHTHASSATTSPSPPASLHATVHGTTISLEQNLLAKNDQIADRNRAYFSEQNILALNLVSSPGAGKTTLLTRTLRDMGDRLPFSVIEGDQETLNDAQRIRETGCPVIQVNTGTGCHLEASMVERGIQTLNPASNSVLMIENVGNLVCPALFDLGEAAKVAILSVTEGDDKPIKYPHMFRASQLMIITKIDLLPYISFDVERCIAYARSVNPHMQVFQLSATTGEGLEHWYDWLSSKNDGVVALSAATP